MDIWELDSGDTIPGGGEPVYNGLDLQTQQYYSEHALDLAGRYASASGGVDSWFDVAFPKGARILDVGCAAGRDMLLLLQGGWDAHGVDPCAGFIDEGLRSNPALKGRIFCDSLPGLSTVPDHKIALCKTTGSGLINILVGLYDEPFI